MLQEGESGAEAHLRCSRLGLSYFWRGAPPVSTSRPGGETAALHRPQSQTRLQNGFIIHAGCGGGLQGGILEKHALLIVDRIRRAPRFKRPPPPPPYGRARRSQTAVNTHGELKERSAARRGAAEGRLDMSLLTHHDEKMWQTHNLICLT